MKKLFLLLILLKPALLFAQDTQQIKVDVMTLSDANLEGRGIGTKGLDAAALYLESRFKGIGLTPINNQSFAQKFTVYQNKGISKASISTNEVKASPINITKDCQSVYPIKEFQLKNCPMVFCGYALNTSDYNDFENIDLKNKIALIFRYDPSESKNTKNIPPQKNSFIKEKYKQCVEQGAIAVLLVNGPFSQKSGKLDDLIPGHHHYFSDAQLQKVPLIHLSQKKANQLILSTGLDLEALQLMIDDSQKPHSFQFKDLLINIELTTKLESYHTSNVMGLIKGDGSKKGVYIIGAHYDHIGKGYYASLSGPKNIGKLHLGADDNASGSSAVLHLAQQIQEQPLARDTLFVLFSAEEINLLGSDHFMNNLPIDKEDIQYMINFDMVGRLRADVGVKCFGLKSSPQATQAFQLLSEKHPLFKSSNVPPTSAPSDHIIFFRQKIPVLHYFTNFHQDYHRVTDTWDKINFDGISLISQHAIHLLKNLDNYERIEWDEKATFGEPGRLGIITDAKRGRPIIKKIWPNSVAEKFGMKLSDEILSIENIEIFSDRDIWFIIREYAVGDNIFIKIKRDNKEIIIELTL